MWTKSLKWLPSNLFSYKLNNLFSFYKLYLLVEVHTFLATMRVWSNFDVKCVGEWTFKVMFFKLRCLQWREWTWRSQPLRPLPCRWRISKCRVPVGMAEQYGVVCRLQLKNRKLQKNKKKFQMLVFFFVLFWWLVLSPFLFVCRLCYVGYTLLCWRAWGLGPDVGGFESWLRHHLRLRSWIKRLNLFMSFLWPL